MQRVNSAGNCFAELQTTADEIKNKMKINDFLSLQTLFEKLNKQLEKTQRVAEGARAALRASPRQALLPPPPQQQPSARPPARPRPACPPAAALPPSPPPPSLAANAAPLLRAQARRRRAST